MSHSQENNNKIRNILTAFAVAVRLNQPNDPVVDYGEAVAELDALTTRIENAEYQKGVDAACEVIDQYNLGGQMDGLLEAIKRQT